MNSLMTFTRILNFRTAYPISRIVLKAFDKPHSTVVVDLDHNILDDFTSHLVYRNAKHFNSLKTKFETRETDDNSKRNTQYDNVNVKFLNDREISIYFQDAVDHNDSIYLLSLIEQCIEYKKHPAIATLLDVLSHFSQIGDKESLIRAIALCKNSYPDLSKSNSDFEHFIAEAIWIRGNVDESLEILEKVYDGNVLVRRRIRLMLKYLMTRLIREKSEAALVKTTIFCEHLVGQHRDFYPLTCLWQECMLSEWYSDQNIALELIRRNEELRNYICDRIQYVVFISLQRYKIDVVYRLLETLLALNLKDNASYVLASLLDYQFCMRDLERCGEIIRWSIENDVQLPCSKNIKYISLILNKNIRVPVKYLTKKHVPNDVSLTF